MLKSSQATMPAAPAKVVKAAWAAAIMAGRSRRVDGCALARGDRALYGLLMASSRLFRGDGVHRGRGNERVALPRPVI